MANEKRARSRSKHDFRTCFVIMPFRKKEDPARRDEVDFDAVYRTIIKPAVESLNTRGIRIKCVRCDEIERAGLIHERMLEHIADADVAVVDITTQNPNVFYELGVRHALCNRVTVLVRREGTSNPFNIGGMTTIGYDLEKSKAQHAREAIANFVANGVQTGATDSLVYAVLPGLKASRPAKTIPYSDVEEYEFTDVRGKRIGIVTGNLRHTNLNAKLLKHPIDVWVSSENINMQMARTYDQSISGLIRYLGAKKDQTSNVVEDSVANALAAAMVGRQLVNPGEVVATEAGHLSETHRVKRILHAAAAYGVAGSGYHPIAGIEQCVTNALARVDWDAKAEGQRGRDGRARDGAIPHSILFPLFGTGTARAEIIQSARKQLEAALSYLRARAEFTCVQRVYFLALTVAHLEGLRVALAELGARRVESDDPDQSAAMPVTPRRRATRMRRAGARR